MPRLHPRGGRIEIFHRAQRHALMLPRRRTRTNQLRRPDGLILRPNPASSVSQIAYSRGAGGSFRRAK
jgi:hypothetical protein